MIAAMSFGERITRCIIEAETRRAGEVLFDGLADRLASYIDEEDRARFLADAEKAIGQPVTETYDAFLALLPVDCNVVCGVYGPQAGAMEVASRPARVTLTNASRTLSDSVAFGGQVTWCSSKPPDPLGVAPRSVIVDGCDPPTNSSATNSSGRQSCFGARKP